MDISITTFRNFVPISELLASVVGTIYFYKYRDTPLRYLLVLLWYITLTEFTSWYVGSNQIENFLFIKKNGVLYTLWLYNLLNTISFSVFFFIYYQSIKKKRFKFWIKIFFICFILLSVINWSFIQSFIYEYSELPKIMGSILIIITVLFYFIELLESEKIIVFHRLLLFWVSIGLLLFYTGTIPFNLKVNGYALIPGIHKLFLIITILALIMYLTFTFGFIWSKKE
jgi:hypothetical protein